MRNLVKHKAWGGSIGFKKGEAHNDFNDLQKVIPEIKQDSDLGNDLQVYDLQDNKNSIEEKMKDDYPNIDNLKEDLLFDLQGAFDDFEGTVEDKITKFGTDNEDNLENIANTTVDFILALTGGLASYDDSYLAASLRNYFSEIEQNENKIFTPTDCGQIAATIIGEDITTIAKDTPNIAPGSVYKYTPDLEKRDKWEWDHHFAAITMADGPDHVTMENAGAKSSTKLSKLQFDRSWFFEMYGPNEGQTFKDKYREDFGD